MHTIKSILSAQFVGNAYSDGELLDAIHDFIADEDNTMKDRCMALQKMDQMMGEDSGIPTAREVNEYLGYC